MNDSIREPVERVRRRLTASLWLFGASAVAATVFGLAFLFGWLDWLVHVDDAGTRFLLATVVAVSGAFVAWRFLFRPLRNRPDDVELARRVEQRLPLRCRGFASGVAFAQRGLDPSFGSPEMQRLAIADVSRRVRNLDARAVVPMRDTQRMAAAAIAICLLVAIVVGLGRAEASIALRRLALPFASTEWPRRTQFRWLDANLQPLALEPGEPLRVARGRSLELFVENALGELPEAVTLERRVGKEKDAVADPVRSVQRPGPEGDRRSLGRVVIEVDEGPILFRVTGGDHEDMPFHRIDVVRPPRLEELQVTVAPPAYTGEPPRELPPGMGHVNGLVGTHVEVRAKTSKRVREATLHLGTDGTRDVEVAEDGRSLTASFPIERAGVQSYWFQLVDRQGYESGGEVRYEVRGVTDAVPTVTIEEPDTNRPVTPTARVPIHVVAKDDLGLTRIDLVYQLDGDSGDPADPRTVTLQAWEQPTERGRVEWTWNLAELGLQPGSRLVFHAEARDAFQASDEHVGRSTPRTLLVVGPQEKADELAGREAALQDELDDLATRQRRARERVGELRVQLDTAGKLGDGDLDLLKSVELDQRRIADELAGEGDGVLTEARRLLDEMQANDVEEPEGRRRLERLIDELDRLRESVLPAIEGDLVRTRKEAESRRDEELSAESREAIAGAERGQDDVLDTLDEQLAGMSRWRNRRELESDLDDLVAGQREIRDRTAGLLNAADQGTGEASRADRERLAERLRSQAERADRFREKLEQAATRIESNDPDAAANLRDAAKELGERATAAAIREAAAELQDRIGKARPGRSLSVQQRVLEDLEEAAATLADQPETDAETLAKRLREAEEDVAELQKRQREQFETLRKKAEAGEELTEPELETLRKRQQEDRESLGRTARQLRRLQARRAASSAQRAERGVEDVERLLAESRRTERPAERQREVLDDLEQTRLELAESRRDAEERLARELLESVAESLRSMAERQQAVVDEATELAKAVRERGTPSRSQSRSLIDLGQVQRGLATETEALEGGLTAAEVFVLVLAGAREQMEAAATRLADKQADEPMLQHARAAHERLAELVAVLEETRNAPDAGGPRADAEPSENDGPRVDVVALMAQVRLLRSLQRELLDRTATLDERVANGEIEAETAAEERADIAGRQERLADVAAELIRKLTPAGPAPSTPDVESLQPEE